MGKLSHIDDVEQRNAAAEQEQMRAAQEALSGARASEVASASSSRRPAAQGQFDAVRVPRAADEGMSAQDEEDFHGLSSVESMGIGQKFLIVLAAIVVIAAILYVLNSWLHFV